MLQRTNPKITLVGAGPGDPELLAIKGAKAIRSADVILYDALTGPGLLEMARPGALLIYVGKRAGKHRLRQEEINQLMVGYARSHGHVVRLKGGDPFVFGRGQEEVAYAREQQLEVEVIPGISSCIAVPELQLVPPTRRGYSESFWVITGTTRSGALSEDINILVIYRILRQKEIHAMAVNLRERRVLWETLFAPEDMVLQRDYSYFLVDNSGNLFFILEKENRKAKAILHYLEFYEFGPRTDTTLHRFLVPLEGRMTYDVKFSFDNLNERLIGGGLYSEDNLQRTEGTYFLSIPPRTPDKYLLAFDPFEDQFVAAFLGKDFSSKNKGISETDVQEIVHRQDGGILLIAERNRALERRTGMARTSYDRLTGRFIVDYYYDDLFVASIHPNGKTHWRNILHKRQYSQDDDAAYSSYFLLKTPYNLRLLFNDEIKYENTVSEYVIQGNGHFDRNAVMSTENQKLRLRFTDAIQVASNALIVPSERRNRLKLVKVTY